MTAEHTFIPFRPAPAAVSAGCSCGWVSAYAHADEKYAAEDHTFHVEKEST